MKRLKGLPLERHQQIGTALKYMRDVLVTMAVEVGNNYSVATRIPAAANRARKAVDQLRCLLDDAVFAEHGGVLERPSRIYYPGTQDEQQAVGSVRRPVPQEHN